jgi:Domain of unknown function (DUF397)
MNPSEGCAGAVWRKSTRSDSNGGQCGEVTLLEGRRRRVVGFSQPQGRQARLEEPGWRGADLQPRRVEGLPFVGSDPGVSFVRWVGVSPTWRVVCDAITHNCGSEGIEAGGESPHEPLIDRQLELDVLRQHIARVAEPVEAMWS